MKRWLLKLALFVVLGAIVNVAVAWSIVLIVHPRVDTAPPRELATIEANELFVRYGHDLWLGRTNAEGQEALQWGITANTAKVNLTASQLSRNGVVGVAEIRVGVPMRGVSMARRYRFGPNFSAFQFDDFGGIPIPSALQALSGNDRSFPCRPIWPGFAINTAFYAGVLWLLFAAPFALRRWRRIKRGLCPKCAYDLRGIESSACPECGCLHRHRNLVTST